MEEENEENNENQDDPDYEPQVTSNNPAERKLARKLRIQRRAEALRLQQERTSLDPVDVPIKPETQKGAIEVQIEKSGDFLNKLIIDGEEYVTNVRIANEARETDRRERLGIGKEKLLEELEEEANDAQQMFNNIANKWMGILKYNDPLHINEDIVSQKEKCDDLIRQKDALIEKLRAELRMAELNFSSDQRKQVEDINSLARRIENQICLMRKAYRQELQMIEDVILAERQLLIESNNKKWEELAKKRDQEEKANSDKKTEEYWNFVRDMDILNRDFQELYRETNIALENDCDALYKELERIKTEALMNSEKLDYNYQILKKREDENRIIRSQQKRRINKMQDYINSLRKKINGYRKQTSQQISKLTEDVKKLSKNVIAIEEKADLMAKVNNNKFQQIWDMNKEKADKLFKKVLDIDKILHQQQLGLTWVPPQQQLLTKLELESYKKAQHILAKPPMEQVESDVLSLSTMQSGSELAHPQEETANYRRIIRDILTLIADKTGFLIEDQLKAIIEPYLEAEKSLIKVDNVFAALNVVNRQDIELLFKHFLPYMYCPICTVTKEKSLEEESLTDIHETEQISFMETDSDVSKTKGDTVVEMLNQAGIEIEGTGGGTVIEMGPMSVTIFDGNLEGECKGPPQPELIKDEEEDNGSGSFIIEKNDCHYNHPLVISSVYVLKALKEFLGRYHIAKTNMPTMSARLAHKRNTFSRLLTVTDIELFWKRFTEVFPPEREQLWDSLLEGLKRYHEILKQRKEMSEEVVVLRRQNKELRKLFTDYIDRKPLPY